MKKYIILSILQLMVVGNYAQTNVIPKMKVSVEDLNFFKTMAGGFAVLCKEAPTFPSENEVHFKLETYTVDLSYEARQNGVYWTIMKYNMIIE